MPTEVESDLVAAFDSAAPVYASLYSNDSIKGLLFQRRYQLVEEFLKRAGGGSLLDVGCGPGLMCPLSNRLGFRFVGIDLSPGMIAQCQQAFGGQEAGVFHVGRVQEIPYPDGCFDVVLCLGVLEYVPEAELDAALREITRVLKPQGLLIASYLNKGSLYWWWEQHLYNALRYAAYLLHRLTGAHETFSKLPPRPERRFLTTSLAGLYNRNKLAAEKPIYYGVNIFCPPFDHILPRAALALCRRIEGGHLFLNWATLAFMVVAKKAD